MKPILGAALAALLGALLPSCTAKAPAASDAGPADAAASSASSEPPAAATVALRRPTQRYFFAKTQAHCEVYSVAGEQVTTPEVFPCPLDLNVGERIRITGKACLRESADPERVEPVVCPDPLTNLEKRDLARAHPPK